MRNTSASIAIALLACVWVSCGNKQQQAPAEPPPGPDTNEPGAVEPVAAESAGTEDAGSAVEDAAQAMPEPATADAPQAATDAQPEAKAAGKGPKTIALAAKADQGPVAFPHKEHHKKASCAKCHHELKPGGKPVSCRDCHGPDPKTLTAKEAFHGTCKGCHKKEGMSVECDQCHGK